MNEVLWLSLNCQCAAKSKACGGRSRGVSSSSSSSSPRHRTAANTSADDEQHLANERTTALSGVSHRVAQPHNTSTLEHRQVPLLRSSSSLSARSASTGRAHTLSLFAQSRAVECDKLGMLDPRHPRTTPTILTLLITLTLSLVRAAPTYTTLPVRPLPGLPSNGLLSNGIHLGFLPFWSLEGPTSICSALGSCSAIWGDYWNASPSSYDFEQAGYHIDEVERVVKGDVEGVYAPAVLFSGRMDEWTDEMSQSLARTVRGINRRGVKVWLRWCFEMNGGWMSYGLQPEDYITTFRSVTNAIRAATNETYMLWSPNLWTGEVDDPIQGYTPYWPGEDFVDIVGLSFYSFGPEKSLNKPASSSLFRDSFSPFYSLFSPSSSSSSNRLKLSSAYSIIISETSAPYYYRIPPSSRFYTQAGDTDLTAPYPNLTSFAPALADPPYEKSDDELYTKASWLVQMVGNDTAQRFPNFKAATWFNYLKKGNGTAEVLADFRFVGGNSSVEGWLRENLGNQTAYEEGYTGAVGRMSVKRAFGAMVVGVALVVVLVAV